MTTQATLITPLRLAESLMVTITGYTFRKPEIININEMREDGDLTFSIDLEEWEDYINTNVPWYPKVLNILHYYKFRALVHPDSEQWTDALILQVLKNSVSEFFFAFHPPIIVHSGVFQGIGFVRNFFPGLFYG